MADQSGRTKKLVCTAVILAAVALVAYQFLGGGDPFEGVPDDQHLATPWACQACGGVFHLTPRERTTWQAENSRVTLADDAGRDEPSDEEGQTSFRQLILQCRSCGKLELRKAAACPRCRTAFAPILKRQPQSCTECGWSPSTQESPSKARHKHPAPRASQSNDE